MARILINESEKQRILNLYNPIDENSITPLTKLLSCKITNDHKYLVYEGTAYNIQTGDIVPINEDWSLSDIIHAGVDLVSAGVDYFVPGSGAIVDIVHALSYIVEAQFKSEEETDNLYLMAAITFAFGVLPGQLQAVAPALKAFVSGSVKTLTKPVLIALRVVGRILEEVLVKIPAYIGKAVNSTLGKKLLGKYASKVGGFFSRFAVRARQIFQKLIPAAGKTTSKTAGKTSIKKGLQTLSKNLKDRFYSFVRMAKPIANPVKVMRKLGFITGKSYRYVGKNGKATTAKILNISDSGVQVLFGKGQKMMLPAETFIKNAVGAPWGRRGYTVAVPLFMKRFADFLTSSGDFDSAMLDKFEDLDPNMTSEESLAFMQEEVSEYQGDTKQYSVNDNAVTIQNALMKLGYSLPKYGADGKFGPETKTALSKFQKDNGLSSSTGKMDRMTSRKLAELLKSKNIEDSEELQSKLEAM